MNVSVIIVAAGSGKRMKSAIAKQYLDLKGRSILSYTVEVFEESPVVNEIILVTGKDEIEYVKSEIIDRYGFTKIKAVVEGGSERQYSVENGLNNVSDNCDIVMIHDGVRPFIDENSIEVLAEDTAKYGACVLGVFAKDTIKICDENGFVVDTPNRKLLWHAQKPQCFKYDVIKKAYEKAKKDNYLGTDDSMLVERTGQKIKMVEGSYDNIKITTPEDLYVGERILERNLNK